MLNPARKIIEDLGGPGKVASSVGIHRTRVSNWCRPKEKGGTGGIIPQRHHPALLDLARSSNVDLRAEDFLPTREPSSAT